MVASIVSPFKINGTPCKSSAKGCKDDVITFFKLLFPFPEAKRNCCRSGISVSFDIYHNNTDKEIFAKLSSPQKIYHAIFSYNKNKNPSDNLYIFLNQ